MITLIFAAYLCSAMPAAAPATSPAVRVTHEGSQPRHGKAGITVLMLEESNPAAYVGRLRFDPGSKAAAHKHETSDETIVVLSGRGVMHSGASELTLGPGDSVFVPRGVEHDFANPGTVPVEAIQVYTPKGPEERFRAWPRVH